MDKKEIKKNPEINDEVQNKPKDNINFISKVRKIQDDSLKKKVDKIENRHKIKKEKLERKNNPKARKKIFKLLMLLIVLILIVILLFSTVIDTKKLLRNINFSNNIDLLNKELEKLLESKNEEEGFLIGSLNSKILAYDTDGFYIDLVDDLYDYKNEYSKECIAILNGKLVYMGHDEEFRKIAEKKGILLDYTIFENMYLDLTDFQFNKENGVIEAYNGKYEIIVIPSVIDGVEVKEIGPYAFHNKDISLVIMPDTIKYIANNAFANNKISYINFPNTIEKIGDYAFYKNEIANLSLGENIKEIGAFAFASNEITSIDITSENVQYGAACFNQNYLKEEEAYIYNSYMENEKYEIVSYGGTSKNIAIEEGIIKVGNYAFCKFDLGTNKYNEITSVSFPNSLKIIGSSAFKNNDISSLNIPNNIGYIGKAAFKNNNISSLIMENRENIYFGTECFNNNNLSNEYAFIISSKQVNEEIINVDYNGITFVDYLYDNNTEETNVLDEYIVTERTLISYAGKNREKVIVPYSVINISEYAFSDCNIKEVEISSSIKSIGYNAFSNNNLTKITIPENVEKIGYNAFANNSISEILIKGKATLPESFDTSIKEVTENIIFN